jgi:hypothetical protein
MANDITGNPWILDTAAFITKSPVRIKRMEWKPSAAADDLTVKDRHGDVFWDRDALDAAPGGDEFFEPGDSIRMMGFDLDTIDGGVLYVWVI